MMHLREPSGTGVKCLFAGWGVFHLSPLGLRGVGAGAHPERSFVRKQTQKKVAGNDVLRGSQDNDLLIETLFFSEGTSSSYSLGKEHQKFQRDWRYGCIYSLFIYLLGWGWQRNGEKGKTKKQKQERASERTWLSPLWGEKNPLCSLNIGVIEYAFFSFKQALEGAICPLAEI